jgi:hypothetical protein
MTTSSDPTETAVIGLAKPATRDSDLAQDLARFHAHKYACPRCWIDQLCDFHRGYVEGARAMSNELDR